MKKTCRRKKCLSVDVYVLLTNITNEKKIPSRFFSVFSPPTTYYQLVLVFKLIFWPQNKFFCPKLVDGKKCLSGDVYVLLTNITDEKLSKVWWNPIWCPSLKEYDNDQLDGLVIPVNSKILPLVKKWKKYEFHSLG